jgi:sodium-dependent dicarboxylate transporter 2/3/5
MKGTKVLGLVLAPAFLFVAHLIPESDAISRNGIISAVVMLAVLVLLISEALPHSLAALFGPASLIFLGVATPGQAFFGFSNHVVYFILTSAVISHALSSAGISKRVLYAILKRVGGSVEAVVAGLMVCTAILSALTSNIATVLIFLPLCLDFLEIYDNEEDKRRTGRTLMLALPIATGIGCVFTPAGSSLHLLMLGLLESATGFTVPFFSWMLIGIPWVAFVLPVGILAVIKLNKPAPLSREKLDTFVKTLAATKKMNFKEKYILIVILAILAAWIVSTWVPFFQITAVAVIGCIFLILSGHEGLKWKEVEPSLPWTIVFMVGSFISMTHVLTLTGASTWLARILVPTTVDLPIITLSLIVALVAFVMLILIPQQTALIPVMSVPVLALAGVAGVNPVTLMMVMAFTVSTTYLLPYSSVPLLTYVKGYFSKGDLAKTTLVIQVWLGIVTALWVPFMVGVLGLGVYY